MSKRSREVLVMMMMMMVVVGVKAMLSGCDDSEWHERLAWTASRPMTTSYIFCCISSSAVVAMFLHVH